MNTLKAIAFSAAFMMITACSIFEGHNEVEKLNKASAAGSPFTQQLTAEYRAFANYELRQERDYADALHFARKGLDSAAGIVVMPEPVHDWDLTAHDINELSQAYARLVSAFDRGAREILPGKSAIAQARYDCWIEKQEEVGKGQNGDMTCKADFLATMSEVESALPVVIPAPVFAAPPVEEMFPAPVAMIGGDEPLNIQEAMYLVFFDFDKSTVSSGGAHVIDAVIDEVNARNIRSIHIVGHTDTMGSHAYNDRLANRRAGTVKAEMIARGVPAHLITTDARGKNELLVNTADGVREPANRRAVITFQ